MSEPNHLPDLNSQLPWLVNGSLSEAERQRVLAALSDQPALQAERAFFEQLKNSVQNDTRPSPGELGWQRLRRRIEAESAAAHPRIQPLWWQRLAVAASVMVVLQAGWMWWGMGSDENYTPLSAPAPAVPAHLTVLQLRLQPQATVADVQTLLLPLGAQLVSGPSASGVYRLTVPQSAMPQALTTLRQATAVVQLAEVE